VVVSVDSTSEVRSVADSLERGTTEGQVDAAAWLYTTNSEFFSDNPFYSGTRTQSENPVVAFEGPLSYDIEPRPRIPIFGEAARRA
jgi:hypothetical protein